MLEKQRQDENLRLAGLDDLDDLREVLREAALCVVQSGNETARLTMLKERFQGAANPIADLLKQSQESTGQSEDKALNNLLTTFYLKPGEGDKRGSVEFAHKSFGEYLFAERIKAAFEDWTELDRKGKRLNIDDRTVNEQIYDLLGYGGLSVEIVEYLFELLKESELSRVKLFERLHGFYQRWCEGEFLDQDPTENWPQKKRRQLAAQDVPIGLKQVDVFAGLNVLIVLFKLHAEAQHEDYPNVPENEPKPEISFHPCGEPGTNGFERSRLLEIIHYADSLETETFTQLVGPHLSRASLSGANLSRANLSRANLSSANLSRANLSSANFVSAKLVSAKLSFVNLNSAALVSAKLDNANLVSANLVSTNLSSTSLSGANLSSANLVSAKLDGTNLSSANLINANLSGANLVSANLSNANLSSAKLSSANLNDTNLHNTDFNQIKYNIATQWANARGLHETQNVLPELLQKPSFAAAAALSQGLQFVMSGNISKAINAYQEAQTINPIIEISAISWNSLCWFGSLYGDPSEVIQAGEKAVALDLEDNVCRDTRGLARALTGDIEGALADFQAALDGDYLTDHERPRRERWVEVLKAGQNPFTPDELEALRQAEGLGQVTA